MIFKDKNISNIINLITKDEALNNEEIQSNTTIRNLGILTNKETKKIIKRALIYLEILRNTNEDGIYDRAIICLSEYINDIRRIRKEIGSIINVNNKYNMNEKHIKQLLEYMQRNFSIVKRRKVVLDDYKKYNIISRYIEYIIKDNNMDIDIYLNKYDVDDENSMSQAFLEATNIINSNIRDIDLMKDKNREDIAKKSSSFNAKISNDVIYNKGKRMLSDEAYKKLKVAVNNVGNETSRDRIIKNKIWQSNKLKTAFFVVVSEFENKIHNTKYTQQTYYLDKNGEKLNNFQLLTHDEAFRLAKEYNEKNELGYAKLFIIDDIDDYHVKLYNKRIEYIYKINKFIQSELLDKVNHGDYITIANKYNLYSPNKEGYFREECIVEEFIDCILNNKQLNYKYYMLLEELNAQARVIFGDNFINKMSKTNIRIDKTYIEELINKQEIISEEVINTVIDRVTTNVYTIIIKNNTGKDTLYESNTKKIFYKYELSKILSNIEINSIHEYKIVNIGELIYTKIKNMKRYIGDKETYEIIKHINQKNKLNHKNKVRLISNNNGLCMIHSMNSNKNIAITLLCLIDKVINDKWYLTNYSTIHSKDIPEHFNSIKSKYNNKLDKYMKSARLM